MSDISTVYDLLDSSAKRYPIKALCDKLDKAESTIRGELNRQPGHKLSLSTSIKIIQETNDMTPLDAIEEIMGRVAFTIPKPEPGESLQNIMSLISSLTREFGHSIEVMAKALQDGIINKKEVQRCLQQNRQLLKETLKMQAHLEAIV